MQVVVAFYNFQIKESKMKHQLYLTFFCFDFHRETKTLSEKLNKPVFRFQ